MEVEKAISNIKNIKLFMEIENDKNPDCQFSQDNIDALSEAVKALEKEIPKEPVEGYVFSEAWRNHLASRNVNFANDKGDCCPNCGEYIGKPKSYVEAFGRLLKPYCPWCGQKIDCGDNDGR